MTGASDGIGKQYAIELATVHRLNVVLISRSIDRLDKVAKEIGNFRFQMSQLEKLSNVHNKLAIIISHVF